MQGGDNVVISKEIKHIQHTDLGTKQSMSEFAKACQSEFNPSTFKTINFTVNKPTNISHLHTQLNPELIANPPLSFSITASETATIINRVIAITTDPLLVMSLLSELDAALGIDLQKNHIAFSDNDLPDYLIAGMGHFIPGPPPDHYRPKKKGRILDALLLAEENSNDINKQGVPKFVGFVDTYIADSFVASGNIFTEEKQMSRLTLHGALSHRLLFYALYQAIKKGVLDVGYGDEKKLTPKQLIELLVLSKYYSKPIDKELAVNSITLWGLTLDTVIDTAKTSNDYFDPNQYNFSCRSPLTFNSLLLCFGKELDLPNLQHYLLDSHWKAIFEMVFRVKNSGLVDGIPDNRLYTYCMEALSTTTNNPGDILTDLPFTLTESEALANQAYEPFSPTTSHNIVRKKTDLTKSTGEYASWNNFFYRCDKTPQAPATLTMVRPK